MSRQTKFPKFGLLGVEIDAITVKQATDYIAAIAKNPKTPPAYIVKPYVEFMETALKNSEIAELLNGAELCVPDGVAIVWGANYVYAGNHNPTRLFATLTKIVLNPKSLLTPLPEVFRGINFTQVLLNECAKQKLSVFLVGSPKRSNITQTASYLKAFWPELNIAGHFTGHLNPELEEELIKTLLTSKPDVILVGIGFPKQEQLMAKLAAKINHGVLIGEGGSFDYAQLGGRLPRAPHFLQKIGLEWLWRLIMEPWRLKRQLVIVRYIHHIYRFAKTAK